VQALAEIPGVRVTGTVPDVRPYLAHAQVSVAPLRIARGIQNKVLEAMAMGMRVVVSPQALEGIAAENGRDLILAEDAQAFITKTAQLLQQKTPELGAAARNKVETIYGWASHLSHVDELLEAKA
jgi:glycosyltransferase involved in cell wall biosynthesis